MSISSKNALLAAWAFLALEITLMILVDPTGNRRPFVLTTYYIMSGLSLFGFIQSFRQKTRLIHRTLCLATFLLTALIIYLMHIRFMGALD